MKAILRSARLAPKKANLIAALVRNMPVDQALISLERTNKKGARIVEKLLKSAIANASHNDQQHRLHLVIKSIVVNQGQGMQRGVPMARGRMRPMTKFFSHISVELGIADHATEKPAKKQKASTETQSPVEKKPRAAKKSKSSSADSSASSK